VLLSQVLQREGDTGRSAELIGRVDGLEDRGNVESRGSGLATQVGGVAQTA
jgi:hypothetical protein